MKRVFARLAFLAIGLTVPALDCACGGEAPAPQPPPSPPPPVAVAPVEPPPAPTGLVYPQTRRVEQVDTLFGVQVADPYRWLEDGSSDEVKAWAQSQDSFARSHLANLPGREAMVEQLRKLSYIESVGEPQRRGNRVFYAKREANQEKSAIYWREGRNGADKVLLDPNTWSSDGSSSLGTWNPSWDGRRIVYSVKTNNSDEATLYVMDVATGKKSDVDTIPGARYAGPQWTPSGRGFYYTWIPPKESVAVADRPGYQEVRFHELGADPGKDRVVRERTGDPKSFLVPSLSKNGRWLVLSTQHGWTRNDVELMDLRAPNPKWAPLAVGQDATYDVSFDGDRFFVRTNEGAPMGRVFRVDPRHHERDHWTEIVAERKDATLEGIGILGHRVVLDYLKDVVSVAELRDESGKLVRTLPTPTLGSLGGVSGDEDDDTAYYSFRSYTYPTEIFETNVATGKTSSFYRLKVPVDPSKYVVEQLFTTSKDGTRLPFFVVHAAGFVRDGKAPTILYGYGGFEVAETPAFIPSIFPWLDRGGVWVSSILRGGSEYGEEWHRHGMLHEKQHVFDDYLAVAEELIKQQITSASKLAALGGSNGGLLVGAALTQRPDLFRVALCGVPLLDMVRYHLYGSGKTWMEEYGSPDDAEDFKALLAYSPYHHVTRGTKYPATLLLSADSDDRVDPMHARKLAAELQWATSGGPVLLRVEKNAGHGGADLVKSYVERVADEYAFALDQMK